MTAEALPLPAAQPRRSRIGLQPVIYVVLFALVGVFVLYPLVVIVLNSFLAGDIGGARSWSLESWQTAVSDPALQSAIVNTLKVIIANEGISMPLAVMLAWLLARTDLPCRGGLEFMFWVGFFLPSLSVTMGWIVLLDPQAGLLNQLAQSLPFVDSAPFNIYSFWGIVWAHLATSSVSVKVILLTPMLRNLDASFEEVARVSGASRWKTLRLVVIPLALPALLTVLVLSTIRALQTFEIEMVLGPPFDFWVFGSIIYKMMQQLPPQFGPATALATMAFLLITPLIVCHRWLIGRKDYASISGRIKLAPTPLGKWRTPLFVMVLAITVTFTVVPIIFLLAASFMKLFGFINMAEPWTLSHWTEVLTDDFFDQSLMNTLKLAAGAAICSVIFSALTAYFAVRSRYPGRGILDFLSWLPFAIPGLLMGVGLLYVVLGNPLLRPIYGSIPLLIIAAVVTHMTLGVQILKANLVQLGDGLEEAARTSGASWWQTFRRIVVPIIMPTLILVGVLSFIGATRDIASVALLASNDTKTLSLLQLDYMIDGRSESAAVISVVVIALTTGIAFLARMFGLKLGVRD